MITFTKVETFSWNCFTREFEMWVGTAYVQWSDDAKSCTTCVEFILGTTRVAATGAAILRALLTRARASDAPCLACSAGLPAAPVFSDRVPMRSCTCENFGARRLRTCTVPLCISCSVLNRLMFAWFFDFMTSDEAVGTGRNWSRLPHHEPVIRIIQCLQFCILELYTSL